MSKPISPSEVAGMKNTVFPPEVFDAFNELIAQNYHSGYSTVGQTQVVNLMVKKGLKKADIYKNNWLDIEVVYMEAGWGVSYDKPAYNESYEPTFTFSKKR